MLLTVSSVTGDVTEGTVEIVNALVVKPGVIRLGERRSVEGEVTIAGSYAVDATLETL